MVGMTATMKAKPEEAKPIEAPQQTPSEPKPEEVGAGVPMGANLTATGATFRLWAPAAKSVAVRGEFNGWTDVPMVKDEKGYWFAEVPDVKEGHEYKFYIVGEGSEGLKRDPYGRSRAWKAEEGKIRGSIVVDASSFPWHDTEYKTPEFSELVIYQLHVGVFHATDANGKDQRPERPGRYLDVVEKLGHLNDLGITAIQVLPIQEFETARSMGYNSVDYFAPETDYTVPVDHPDFERYLKECNEILTKKGLQPYEAKDLNSQTKQFMALVDLAHLHGIAVILDVVYNHAGGNFDDESMYFLDRQPYDDQNNSLYFTEKGWAGGLGFAYWKEEVRQFLIDNSKYFLDEYHIDGYRFDEVTVIDRFGGWEFLQHMTETLRAHKPNKPLIAEYWADHSSVLKPVAEEGAGFDCVVDSSIRGTLREVLAQAIVGKDAPVVLDPLVEAMHPHFGEGWRSVHHLENQDVVRINNETDREPRIASLCDPTDSRSWFARSRARWAMGVLLTSPGIPMIFMGQEFLEDKFWTDSPDYYKDAEISWDRLANEKVMQDYLKFTTDLVKLRTTHPALKSGNLHVFHVHNESRVMAYSRWTNDEKSRVVVVANLNEVPHEEYSVGFPSDGEWTEVFNSDLYDNFPNPEPIGNAGKISADGSPEQELPHSAKIRIPANGFVIFSKMEGVIRSFGVG